MLTTKTGNHENNAIPSMKSDQACKLVYVNISIQDADHCHEIVRLGGLQTLLHTYMQRKAGIVVCRNIARIVGNLAVHEDLHAEILRAGKKVCEILSSLTVHEFLDARILQMRKKVYCLC